jgi:pumilio family protein 6
LYRSTKELFDNEYGRKVITYLIAPRDSRFFLKDFVKRLEIGDNSETSKKDPEIKRKELFDYSKTHLKAYIKKEITALLFNGAGGILVPIILDQLSIIFLIYLKYIF